ncbi:hypothetical protein [Phycicoccus avicenniae]|uniref:hypothetical protein n=1 Tax=Phycicoccus avicenniae TaxID=2828860 RepID=UPI003D288707
MPSDSAPGDLAWHYTDGPGLLSILGTHTLWATAAPFLNDREEVRLGGRMVVDRVLEVAGQHDERLAAELAERVRSSTEQGEGPGADSAFILSASRSPDSLAMWRLYGGTRESYAIGLDPGAGLAALSSREVDVSLDGSDGVYLRHQGWRPVRYDRDAQLELVDAALAVLDDLAGGLGTNLFSPRPVHADETEVPDEVRARLAAHLEPFLEALHEALLLIKHEGFADERETRWSTMLLTRPGSEGSRLEAALLSYRASAYGIAPYLRLTGPDPQRPEASLVTSPSPLPVRAVAVSPSPNGPEAEASVRQVLLAHGYDVPVLRSAIPFRG